MHSGTGLRPEVLGVLASRLPFADMSMGRAAGRLILTTLPKDFGQQREVVESKDPSWFYVLGNTYRHAQEKLYFFRRARPNNQSSGKYWGLKTFPNVRSRELVVTGHGLLCRSP